MEIICTRPNCTKPHNFFGDLDDPAKIRTVPQKYCTNCGMPLILADRYLPSKLLGQGGFGAAFLACDRYKPKMPLCVVKQFQPSGNLDSDELEVAQNLFQREAIVLEELGHKHRQIPDLYAFFTPIVSASGGTGEEEYFYLAQEYIDGEDLDTELEARGKFSEAEVREILREILYILQFVHDNNTIHRDIKPSNIMRDREGIFYLLDFGAVKQIAVSGGNNKTSTGIYSMGFAPPEQMSGAQIYPSTDMYALAVTCITLLTGKPPEELHDSFNHSWNWLEYAPETSDRLTAILNKMLQDTPAQRFQTAEAALAALDVQPVSTGNSQGISTHNYSDSRNQLPQPSQTDVSIQPRQPRFSLLEVLSSAAFTGFEGALLYTSLTSVFSVSGISIGILGMTMAGLIFALNRRLIEKIDLAILAAISAAMVAFVPILQGGLTAQAVLIIALMSAAGAIAITAFFRLIYQLLSHWL